MNWVELNWSLFSDSMNWIELNWENFPRIYKLSWIELERSMNWVELNCKTFYDIYELSWVELEFFSKVCELNWVELKSSSTNWIELIRYFCWVAQLWTRRDDHLVVPRSSVIYRTTRKISSIQSKDTIIFIRKDVLHQKLFLLSNSTTNSQVFELCTSRTRWTSFNISPQIDLNELNLS